MVKRVYEMGVPLNLHANGDGAIDAFFKAHEFAAAGDLSKDRHVTMIHAQFTRKDQLDKYVQYRIRPSFYTLHTYYFYEAHLQNRGRGAGAVHQSRCAPRSTRACTRPITPTSTWHRSTRCSCCGRR